MVKDLASQVRKLYNVLGKSIDSSRSASSYDRQCWGNTSHADTQISTYHYIRAKMRDYFPELKLKIRYDEKD